jgi:hypothetical protein
VSVLLIQATAPWPEAPAAPPCPNLDHDCLLHVGLPADCQVANLEAAIQTAYQQGQEWMESTEPLFSGQTAEVMVGHPVVPGETPAEALLELPSVLAKQALQTALDLGVFAFEVGGKKATVGSHPDAPPEVGVANLREAAEKSVRAGFAHCLLYVFGIPTDTSPRIAAREVLAPRLAKLGKEAGGTGKWGGVKDVKCVEGRGFLRMESEELAGAVFKRLQAEPELCKVENERMVFVRFRDRGEMQAARREERAEGASREQEVTSDAGVDREGSEQESASPSLLVGQDESGPARTNSGKVSEGVGVSHLEGGAAICQQGREARVSTGLPMEPGKGAGVADRNALKTRSGSCSWY